MEIRILFSFQERHLKNAKVKINKYYYNSKYINFLLDYVCLWLCDINKCLLIYTEIVQVMQKRMGIILDQYKIMAIFIFKLKNQQLVVLVRHI